MNVKDIVEVRVGNDLQLTHNVDGRYAIMIQMKSASRIKKKEMF